MKTLLKKMRLITTCIVLWINVLCNAQNTQTITLPVARSGIEVDTSYTIDFDYLASIFNKNTVDAYTNYYPYIMILNADGEKRGFNQYLSTTVGWNTVSLLDSGVFIGINESLVGFHELYYYGAFLISSKSGRKVIKESVCRLNSAWYGFTVGDSVSGYYEAGGGIVDGLLLDTTGTTKRGIIQDGEYEWIIDYNTIFDRQ